MILFALACIGLQSVPGGKDTAGDAGGPGEVGGLEVSSTLIDFGEVQPGDLREESLTLSNDGSAVVQVEAALEGEAFSVDLSSLDVGPGKSEVLTLSFEPGAEGEYAGVLALSTGDDELDVALAGSASDDAPDDSGGGGGSGPAGDISVDPTSLSFSTLTVGDTEMQSLTVRNVGDDVLTVIDFATSDSAFTTRGNLDPGDTIDPGDERTLEVYFEPSAAGLYSAKLTLESDDPDERNLDVALSGGAEEGCTVCAPRIDVDTGTDPYAITDFAALFGPDTRTIVVSNDGDQVLTVNSVYVNNDMFSTCGEFYVSGWGGMTSLAPGDSTSFSLTYDAVAECIELAWKSLDQNVLHIISNDPAEPDYVIELQALGF
ncbi:MAG: choice-of-anchor D domain-containing protein [Deltaproteobacteria bacterium]|nr:choice-of-anchor D domain-containing protein [Deltaproteobacteria bacterium]